MKLATVALAACLAGPALAALPVGAPAPRFTAEAALGGKTFSFSLAEALRDGPVVLYFYPKAYTSGCTIEAHAFAEATPRFEALGARVVGMSNDDIATLQRFSVEACRNKFAVAADRGARITQRYDAAIASRPEMADRISYVIDPQGRIVHVHAGSDPQAHVRSTLQAVEAWRREQPVR